MKKFLITVFVFFTTIINAQKGANEVYFDVADAIVIRTIEFGYERYVLESSSVGISALFNLAKADAGFKYNEQTMYTPYFRHYLNNGSNFNYFGEIFFGINKQFESSTDLAVGAGVGLKYVSNGGVLLAGSAGIGRNFFKDTSKIVVPRLGITAGYRF